MTFIWIFRFLLSSYLYLLSQLGLAISLNKMEKFLIYNMFPPLPCLEIKQANWRGPIANLWSQASALTWSYPVFKLPVKSN